MLLESTSLASLTGLLATSLREEYGIDPGPVFADAGLPLSTAGSPRLRHPVARMRRLWELSKEASGDETIGLKTGQYAKPGYFYAFGHSWLASATLLDAMQRLTRYSQLISTAVAQVTLAETADSYALSTRFTEGGNAPPKEGIDCAMTALLALCDIAAEKEIRPLRVELTCRADVHPDAYREALRAPVRFGAEVGVFHFDKDVLTAPCRTTRPTSPERQTRSPRSMSRRSTRTRSRRRSGACSSRCCRPAMSARTWSPAASIAARARCSDN